MSDSTRLVAKDRAARLGALGFLLAAAWLVVSIGVDGESAGALRVVAQVVGGVGAPLLAVAALLLLVVPVDGWRRGRRELILCTAAFAFGADLLLVLSFGVGMDEADAGRELGLFGNSTWLFGLATLLALAALVAQLVLPPLRTTGLRPWLTVAAASAIGLAAAPLLALSMLSPVTVAIAALAVTVVALVRPGRPAAEPAPAPAEPRARVDWTPVLRRVRVLAAVSLVSTVAVWAVSLSASIAATGTEGATTALAAAMAAGQLAVLPLLVGGTLVAAAVAPRESTALWAGLSIAAAGVAATSAVLAFGDAVMPAIGLLGLAAGVWLGSVVWALTARRSTGVRIGVAGFAVLAGALLYAVFVAMTGGISLALVSAFVTFGGAKLVARSRATNPGTLPASA